MIFHKIMKKQFFHEKSGGYMCLKWYIGTKKPIKDPNSGLFRR